MDAWSGGGLVGAGGGLVGGGGGPPASLRFLSTLAYISSSGTGNK